MKKLSEILGAWLGTELRILVFLLAAGLGVLFGAVIAFTIQKIFPAALGDGLAQGGSLSFLEGICMCLGGVAGAYFFHEKVIPWFRWLFDFKKKEND